MCSLASNQWNTEISQRSEFPNSIAPSCRDVRLLFILLLHLPTTVNLLFLCVMLFNVCVGLCVSVYGSAEELDIQPLNVLSVCHAEWVDVVRPPVMCTVHRCHPNSCPPTLLLSPSSFHTNPPLPAPATQNNSPCFFTQTYWNFETPQDSLKRQKYAFAFQFEVIISTLKADYVNVFRSCIQCYIISSRCDVPHADTSTQLLFINCCLYFF